MLPTAYLWFKALHIAFMVTWFAGLFYLPRLFIYHAEAEDEASRRRFTTMEKRLFVMMTIGAVVTVAFGLVMLWMNPRLLSQTWLQLKLLLVACLAIYHFCCHRWIRSLEKRTARQSTRALRWFNEIPGALLLAIVILAVLKPA